MCFGVKDGFKFKILNFHLRRKIFLLDDINFVVLIFPYVWIRLYSV